MKRILREIIIIIGAVVLFVLIDTIQAKALNRSTIIKVNEQYNDKITIEKNKGILVTNYVCINKEYTVFNWEDFECVTAAIENK